MLVESIKFHILTRLYIKSLLYVDSIKEYITIYLSFIPSYPIVSNCSLQLRTLVSQYIFK